jgi:hypothetical protein
MAEGTMTLRLLFALMLTASLPTLALAQDATDDQAQPAQGSAPAPADPITAILGLWHVDHVEGSAANDAMSGSILGIERAAVASLTGGTCVNPNLSVVPTEAAATAATPPLTETVGIECLGQRLATATWDPSEPDTIRWVEPDLQAVLHRVTSAGAPNPETDDSGDGGAQ